MADVRVRFIGDAASLRSFYAQLGAETRAFGTAVTRDSENIAKSFFNIGKDTPVQLGRVQTVVDGVNKTFRTMAQSTVTWTEKVQRFSREQAQAWKIYKQSGMSSQDYARANPGGLPQSQLDYMDTLGIKKVFGLVDQTNRVLLDQKEIIAGNYEAWTKLDNHLKQYRTTAINALPSMRALASEAKALGNADPFTLNRKQQGRIQFNQNMATAIENALQPYRQTPTGLWQDRATGRWVPPGPLNNLKNMLGMYDTYVKELVQRRGEVSEEMRKLAELTSGGPQGIRATHGAMKDARYGIASVPAEWQQLFAADKQGQLVKTLQKAGFGKGMGAEALVGEMYSSNLRVVDDITRGVTRVSGSFQDWTGRSKELSVELDRNGKIVSRWGGNFRGLSSMLGQTVRDFQKVIEWTIATTVVFAGLRTALQGFDIIKDINLLLTRFSITAQMSNVEANQMFGNVKDIAYSTATPLMELLTAMDDIAFGTKKAGQTTKEWRQDILSLAEAVGIYTNLTGQDAEAATEILVATMKQLGIEADQVIGVLNKITAVAGGQSKAIADIAQGLSVMGEAGKQAQLSQDQMIAVIKTLSLVTSKTPAEVATAFKNLVGALDNPMALKALESYNIPVKDLEGNLRNIIDIYSEIQLKIKQGIIPAADVKMLIRQISGGPRRAPDAAALLANIGEVQSVTEQSIGATNEALLANSKIMDSINNQWVQLTTLVQGTFYELASGEFGTFATQLIDVGKALVPILESLSKFIVLIVKLGGAYLVLRGVVGGIRFLGNSLSSLMFSLTGINPALLEIARKSQELNLGLFNVNNQAAILPGRLGVIEKKLRGLTSAYTNLGKAISFVAVGAAVGATMGAAASGGDLLTTIGSALSAGGMSALMLPNVYAKVAGGVAMVAGSLMMMNANSKEAVATDKEHARTILNLVATYNEAARAYDVAKKSNEDLAIQIDDLNKTQNKTMDQQGLLADYQNQYITNTQTMTAATLQLVEAQQALGDATGGVTQYLASAGRISPEALDALIQKNLGIAFGEGTRPPSSINYKNLPGLSKTGPTTATTPFSWLDEAERLRTGKTSKLTIDFQNLKAEDLKQIFDLATGKLKIDIPPVDQNYVNLEEAVRAARKELNLSDEAFQKIMQSIQAAAAEFDPFLAGIQQMRVLLEAFKAQNTFTLISSDDLAALQEIIGYYAQLQILINKSNLNDTDKNAAQNEINRNLALLYQTSKIPAGEARNAALQSFATTAVRLGAQYLPELANALKVVGGEGTYVAQVFKFVTDVFKGSAAGLDDVVKTLAGEDLQTLGGDLLKLRNDFLADAASKSSDLQFRLQGGQFKGGASNKDYIFEADQIQGMQGVDAVIQKLASSFKTLNLAIKGMGGTWNGHVEPAMLDMKKSLATIPGLENAASLTTEQLISRMLELGNAANLSKEQWGRYLEQIAQLPVLLDKISKIRVEFKIPVGMDLSVYRKQLEQMVFWLKKFPIFGDQLAKPFEAQLAAVRAAEKAVGDWTKTTGTILGSGKGTVTGGTTPKTKTGPDVSTIDLPEEIANAANRSALIAEAVKRARALQAKIPGAGKEAKNDIVELLKGTQRILEVRGVKDDLLRKALEELAEIERKRLEMETKADTIRRIRVGMGDFAALANVPVNSATGISLGSPQGPITVNLNITGQVLTPAQLEQLGNTIAAGLGRQIG